jgi:hypothetical protein
MTGARAFGNCSFLLWIYIPSLIINLHYRDNGFDGNLKGAFEDCPLLKNVAITPASQETQLMFQTAFSILHNMPVNSVNVPFTRFATMIDHMIKVAIAMLMKCSVKRSEKLQYMDGKRTA